MKRVTNLRLSQGYPGDYLVPITGAIRQVKFFFEICKKPLDNGSVMR